MVRQEEMVELAWAHQRCAVQSGLPPVSRLGAPQMPCPSAQEGQSVGSYHAGCGRERSCGSSCP